MECYGSIVNLPAVLAVTQARVSKQEYPSQSVFRFHAGARPPD